MTWPQISKRIKALKKRPLGKLLIQAREHKRYDTYHSTTLEGYRITPEDVEALLSGAIPKDQEARGESVEKIKNRMAILGYSGAFDFVLSKIQADFSHPRVNEELVKNAYYQLFKPSADAEIIDYLTLVGYRNIPAFIRGTPYVPPSHEKLPELMASFESIINKIEDSIVKAILTHYLFVTIHPYVDGNGRTARLLMNYALLTTGHPWITVRADQRIEYFEALKRGQAENNILPFGEFIVGMLEKATG
ncbi:MAG: Fic family protein [Actinobacteria bacterium]|nr:Fic family protein [Actinomycetota bacterium]